MFGTHQYRVLLRNDFPYAATAIVDVQQSQDENTFVVKKYSDVQVLSLRPSFRAKIRYLATDFVIVRIEFENQTRAQNAVNRVFNLLPFFLAFIAAVAVADSRGILFGVLLYPLFAIGLFLLNLYLYKSSMKRSAERIAHTVHAKLREDGIRPGRL